ncbi:TPA: DotG/IcmE/VirB10 family protein [Pseudomonas aeruginosa]
MSDVRDEEFADIRVGADQRIGGGQTFEQVDSVRGAGAVKGIFNKDNKARLVAVFGVGALLIGAVVYYGFFSGPPELRGIAGETSSGVRVSGSSQAGQQTSQFERQAAQEYNTKVLEERQQNGDPQAHPIVLTDPSDESVKEANPFKPATNLVNPNKVSETGGTEYAAPTNQRQADPQAQANNQGQMDTVLQQLVQSEAEVPKSKVVSWSYSNSSIGDSDEGMAAIPTESTSAGSAGSVTSKCEKIERGGAMSIATADFAVNSDVGGPISLTLRSGKARGRQLIGQFERKDKWLRIELNKMLSEDMDPVPVKAIALDMETTMSGVEGDLDSHIMYRYGWWGLGAVLSAVGKAAENNANEQVIVSDGAVVTSAQQDSSRELKMALGSLGQDLGDAFKDRINRPITVSLKVNEQVGVYFLDDVCASN